MSKVIFTTDKYVVKSFAMDNFEDFALINQDPSVSRYVNHNSTESPKTFRECVDTFQNIVEMQEELGYSYWGIYNKKMEFIGQCGMSRNYDDSLNFCYVINKRYWGKGIGKEITNMILNYTMDNFKNIKLVKAMSFEKNVASLKILLKLGFKIVKTIEEFNKQLYFLELTREDYEQKKESI